MSAIPEIRVVAKAMLMNEQGEILVLRRSPTDTIRPGAADFPGGGVEPGESLVEAVVREIQEEAGLTVDGSDLQLAYTMTSPPREGGNVILRALFIGRVVGTEVQLSFEHDAFRWVNLTDIKAVFDNISWQVGVDFILTYNLLQGLNASEGASGD